VACWQVIAWWTEGCHVDGTFHEVDSSELAFKMRYYAFKDAAKKSAQASLLERS